MVKGPYLLLFMAATSINLIKCVSIEKDLTLTLGQKTTLDKFRATVTPLLSEDHMKTDIYLIRWLRARNFNLDAAESMLKENLRWRRQRQIDKCSFDDFEDLSKDYPLTIDTYDKDRRPIGVVDVDIWDIRGAVVQGKGQRLLQYLDCALENITKQVFERQAMGMNVTQWKIILGADGVNMINHACPICMPVIIQFVLSLESHYTGWLDEGIVVDAPRAFHFILDAVRPLLSPQTRDAIRVFGPNKRQWISYLDERISKSERRAPYGGTKAPVKHT